MHKNRIIINTIKSSVLHFSLSVIPSLPRNLLPSRQPYPLNKVQLLSNSPHLKPSKKQNAFAHLSQLKPLQKKLRATRCKNFAQHHVKSVNLRLNQHHHTPKVPSRGQFLQKNPLSSALRISESVSSACLSQHNPLQKNSVQLGVEHPRYTPKVPSRGQFLLITFSLYHFN